MYGCTFPARRAGVSLGEALKRTKEGSEGEGGRKEPTSTSLASEGGASLSKTSGRRACKPIPFKNSLLGVCWLRTGSEAEALKACKAVSLEEEEEDETVIGHKEVNGKVAISD